MKAICKHCGHEEEVNKHLFLKVLGGTVSGFGFLAWVTFFFAGTGFALPICIALVTGGVALAAFSDEIAAWLCENYECPSCGKKNWRIEK